MVMRFEHPSETIFYGFFLQFLTWDYVFKNWLNKLGKLFKSNEDGKNQRQRAKSNAEEIDG